MSASFWIDSDDEWDDDIYSSEDSGSDKEGHKPTSKFADLDLDDEEEDDKRVTRSAQEKSWDELNKSMKILKNKMFINDWNSVSTEWENMKKIVAKSEPVFSKDGIPRFLTSFFIELEDRVNEMYADKAFKKSASPTNAKSLNAMKQGFKKWLQTHEDQLARVTAFRANPKLAEEEEVAKPQAGGAKKAGGAKAGAKEGSTEVSSASGAGGNGAWSRVGGSTKEDASGAGAKPKLMGRAKWLKKANADSDSSSSSSDDENDTSWLDSDDDDDGEDAMLASATTRRRHGAAGEGKDGAFTKRGKGKARTGDGAASDADTDAESEDDEAASKKEKQQQQQQQQQEWNDVKIDAKVKELVARRGTRNYDRIKQVLLFAYLLERTKEKANTVERQLRIMFALVDSLFDVNTNMYLHMNVKLWKYAYNVIVKIFEIMAANEATVEVIEGEPDIASPVVASSTPASLNASANLAASGSVATAASASGLVKVRGLLISILERLDEEYFKSLQIMDPHTQDYVVRMRHEPALLKLLRVGFEYFERKGMKQRAASVAARRLDHLYYRRDMEGAAARAALREAQRAMASEMQEAAMAQEQQKHEEAALNLRESTDSKLSDDGSVKDAAEGTSTAIDIFSSAAANLQVALNEIPDEELASLKAVCPTIDEEESSAAPSIASSSASISTATSSQSNSNNLVVLVPYLCSLVFSSSDEILRIRAVLQHIYHLALHDKYFEARDRMLATRMQDEIMNANDPSMHVLFNRVLVQLGLAAFRKGRIADAHAALAEIVGPRLKELLAQGLTKPMAQNRMMERTAEQLKLEKRRQLPYPMHINVDLIEFVHLTSAMLLEVPNMAASVYDSRKRPISKTFRKTMENSERQTFTGPPENTKDHVIAASKALMQSDWQLCASLLLQHLDIWKLIPKSEDVKVILKRKIQEEALRTHLFTNSHFYETIKLEQLVTQFQLPKHSVHAIASRMMIHDELPGASWDQPSESIILAAISTPASGSGSSHSASASHASLSHSHLHHLALQYADRISNLFDNSDNDSSTNQPNASQSLSANSQSGAQGSSSGSQGGSFSFGSQGSNKGSQNQGQRRSGPSGGKGGKNDGKGPSHKHHQGNKSSGGKRRN